MSDAKELAIEALVAERDDLRQRCLTPQAALDSLGYPPGHYYSPLVDVEDSSVVRAVRERLVAPPPAAVRVERGPMKILLGKLAFHHRSFPFQRVPDGMSRFYADEGWQQCKMAAERKHECPRVTQVKAAADSRAIPGNL